MSIRQGVIYFTAPGSDDAHPSPPTIGSSSDGSVVRKRGALPIIIFLYGASVASMRRFSRLECFTRATKANTLIRRKFQNAPAGVAQSARQRFVRRVTRGGPARMVS